MIKTEVEYHEKMKQYTNTISTLMYTFEVTKCCDYGEFITCYKKQTLSHLYKIISYHFDGINIKNIYFITIDNKRIDMLNTDTPLVDFIRPFIISTPAQLLSLYAFPSPVIYKLYIETDEKHVCTS